jgi:hypothetical protein
VEDGATFREALFNWPMVCVAVLRWSFTWRPSHFCALYTYCPKKCHAPLLTIKDVIIALTMAAVMNISAAWRVSFTPNFSLIGPSLPLRYFASTIPRKSRTPGQLQGFKFS